MPYRHALLLLLACSFPAHSAPAPGNARDPQGSRQVEQMKQQHLGPFESVRWFCQDGSVLPPKPYACRPHGGGRQHGLRGAQAEALRTAGIPLANVLAEISPQDALAEGGRRLKALLVEQHLVALDDGWIFRKARFARGAFQIEADTAAASRILQALLREPASLDQDFLLAREAVRRLDLGRGGNLLDGIRALASQLAEREAGFARLRNKIHSHPDAADARAVRDYAAATSPAPAIAAEMEKLAQDLDALYRIRPLGAELAAFGRLSGDPAMASFVSRWEQAGTAGQRLDVAAAAMSLIRQRLPGYAPARRLEAMRLSLAAEDAAFASGREIVAAAAQMSAAQRLDALRPLLRALYGSGLLTGRELEQAREAIDQLRGSSDLRLGEYREALALLARPPVWAGNRLQFHLGETIRAFARVEPKAQWLIPDRLRGSPALSYGELLESLVAEADRLSGIRHELFGRPVSSGLRALNPGLARGPLQPLDALGERSSPAIVLAPESAADLPAVAGILTAAEGNALSHVQLLARNLGVPNVVVGSEWLEQLASRHGRQMVLAASPAGVVRLAEDGPQWDALFPRQAERAVSIRVDMARLDLSRRQPLPMADLRAEDSGRSVGPKAAKLGELASRYPGQVSPGLAIPFGAFRAAVLDAAAPGGQGSVLDWMQQRYRSLHAMADGPARQQATSAFLAELRGLIEARPFSAEFRSSLVAALARVFGPDGHYGVFVRSDTNVEDLPGFTGAGLNLTVPHVVGVDNILDAIRRVWASPFTERAYGWRQALMDQPEQLYVAVLLHRTVPADKSGVMITADLTSNDSGWVTVATNEGVGGGVEGQAAESLRIRLDGSEVELLASATEPRARQVLPGGGSALLPAQGPEVLLQPADIEALLAVARSLPQRYPQLTDAQGRPAPADVEFAFADGQLYLNQIRPFLQSDRARSNAFLLSLDEGLRAAAGRQIKLEALR